MAQYSGMNSALNKSVNVKSNRLSGFVVSLQCTDEVKVVPGGTPRSLTSVTCGIRWLTPIAEKDGEMGAGIYQK